MIEKITSVQNPKIKNIVKLQQKSSERKKQNLVVIEGMREISLAIKSGILFKTLFICSDIISIDAVIICDPLTDVYNPNVIRSSVGCVFTN